VKVRHAFLNLRHRRYIGHPNEASGLERFPLMFLRRPEIQHEMISEKLKIRGEHLVKYLKKI
jgi:hypothetical protein